MRGEIDIIVAATRAEVVRGYAELTGRIWMPPRWAARFQQSRWSLHERGGIMDVARNFRKRKIPCDVIYCDIDYMDG